MRQASRTSSDLTDAVPIAVPAALAGSAAEAGKTGEKVESIGDVLLLEEKLAAAEQQLEEAHDRIERLEGLLEAMGIPGGFGLEYVLRSVCPRNALKAVNLTVPLALH
jgi:hypothetical protein